MIPAKLRRLYELISAIPKGDVALHEHWSDNNTYVEWQGDPPEQIQQIVALLERSETSNGEPLLIQGASYINLVRPNIVEHFYEEVDEAEIFFSEKGLSLALVGQCGISDDSFLKRVQQVRRIISPEVTRSFKAGQTYFLSAAEHRARLYSGELAAEINIPEEKLRRQIVIHQGATLPSPGALWPISSGAEGAIADIVRAVAGLHFTACFMGEILSQERIAIKGKKEVKGKLSSVGIHIDEKPLSEMAELCRWAFLAHDNFGKERKKIVGIQIADFVSQDGDDFNLYPQVAESIADIRRYSEDAYHAFLEEKVDSFFDEQKKLIDAIKSLSDSISDRARNLVGSLFRDAFLASVAVAILSIRAIGSQGSSGTPFLKITASLIIMSAAIHLVAAVSEITIGFKDFRSWSARPIKLISKDRRKDIVDDPLTRRKMQFWIMFAITALGYVVVAYAVWHIERVLRFFA